MRLVRHATAAALLIVAATLAWCSTALAQGAEVINVHECSTPYEGATLCLDSNLVISTIDTPSGRSTYIQHERTRWTFSDEVCTVQSGNTNSFLSIRTVDSSFEGAITVGWAHTFIDCGGFQQTCDVTILFQFANGALHVNRDESICTGPLREA